MAKRNTKKQDTGVQTAAIIFTTEKMVYGEENGNKVVYHHAAFISVNGKPETSEQIGRISLVKDTGEVAWGKIGRGVGRDLTPEEEASVEAWMEGVEKWAAEEVYQLETVNDLLRTPKPPSMFVLNGKLYRQTSCSGYSGDAYFKGETVYFEWDAPYVEGIPHTKEDSVAVLLTAEGWALRPIHAGFGSGSQVRDEYYGK